MTDASSVEFSGGDRARELAGLAAERDAERGEARIAIVAPGDFVFALGRMYQAYRTLHPKSRAEVGVFRTLSTALAFLGRGRRTEDGDPDPR